MGTGNSLYSWNNWLKPFSKKIGDLFMNRHQPKPGVVLSPGTLTAKYKNIIQKNAYNALGSAGSGGGGVGIITGTASTSIALEYCRWCGKDVSENGYEVIEFRACEDCTRSVFEKIFIQGLPLIPEVSCQTCKSHINACICPNKQALNNLKQE